MDFPNLPYLMHDNLKLTETQAIHRYLAAKYSPELLDKTPEDTATLDMLAGVLIDVRSIVGRLCYTQDDKSKVQAAVEKVLPKIIKFLDSKKFLLGDSVYWVDFYLLEIIELLNFVYDSTLPSKFPAVWKWRTNMLDLPGVATQVERESKRTFNNKVAKINNVVAIK